MTATQVGWVKPERDLTRAYLALGFISAAEPTHDASGLAQIIEPNFIEELRAVFGVCGGIKH